MRIAFESCPLCEGTELTEEQTADCTHHPLYTPTLPARMRWMRCGGCRHVFVDGYFTEEALALMLANVQTGQKPAWFCTQEMRVTHARMVREIVRTRGGAEGRWLDVGFGNGILMTTAEEFGFDVVGLDLRAESVEAMRSMGYAAFCRDVATWEGEPGSFDVVSMMDVLEHMPFPKRGLGAAHGLLAANGLLYMSMPNMDAFVWRACDAHHDNPYWSELEHLHNFGRARLYELLRAHRFEPVHYDVSRRYGMCMEVVARRV